MFGGRWVPARGTIVQSHILKTTGDGLVSIREYVVDVRTPSGEVFRAKVGEPRISTFFLSPPVGAEVGVEVRTGGHEVRFDKDDPALNSRAAKKRRDDSFDDTLSQAPGTPPRPPRDLGPTS